MADENSKPSRRIKLPKGVYRRTTQHGPVFMALVRVKGFKPVSRTFPTPEEAIEWFNATKKELTTQRRSGNKRADLPKLTVGGLINEYLADPVTKALRSYETYVDRLDWWVNQFGAKRVREFSVMEIREARERLEQGVGLQKKPAPATVNRHLAAMRSTWNWGRTAGLVSTDRAWPSKLMLTEPKGRTRHLSDEELESLLKAAKDSSPTLYAMIVVSLATGIRQGELLRLKWADIDFVRQRARILLTKNNESRAVHLPTSAIEALQAVRHGAVVGAKDIWFTLGGRVFKKSILCSYWNQLRKAAGLKNFHWHDLRHSCASFLAQRGATLLEIGSVLGHKSPSMTMRYAHLVQGAPVTGHAALDEKLKGK